jgi:hypothetical protein
MEWYGRHVCFVVVLLITFVLRCAVKLHNLDILPPSRQVVGSLHDLCRRLGELNIETGGGGGGDGQQEFFCTLLLYPLIIPSRLSMKRACPHT